MKAEEPGSRVPVVKYGMSAEYQDSLVERHATAMADRRAISYYHFVHALLMGPVLRAAFYSIGKRALVQPPVVTVAAPEAPAPDDLRSSLGLS